MSLISPTGVDSNGIIIVFPKVFEYHKFLMTLDLVSMEAVSDLKLVKFSLIENNHINFLCFYALVIEESDIEFTLRLGEKMSKYHKLRWLLIGSCGLDVRMNFMNVNYPLFPLNHVRFDLYLEKLGKAYWVEEASKFDRGDVFSLPNASLNFTLNQTKLVTVKPQLSEQLLGDKVKIQSSNFLSRVSLHNDKFYDMESYEFIRLSTIKNVNLIGCIRVVTDITGGDHNRFVRSCLSFNKVKTLVMNNSELIFTKLGSEPYRRENNYAQGNYRGIYISRDALFVWNRFKETDLYKTLKTRFEDLKLSKIENSDITLTHHEGCLVKMLQKIISEAPEMKEELTEAHRFVTETMLQSPFEMLNDINISSLSVTNPKDVSKKIPPK